MKQSAVRESEAPTTPVAAPLSCPPPCFIVPKHDTTLTTLHVVESDFMDSHHVFSLAVHLQSRCTGTDRTAASGIRRKRTKQSRL